MINNIELTEITEKELEELIAKANLELNFRRNTRRLELIKKVYTAIKELQENFPDTKLLLSTQYGYYEDNIEVNVMDYPINEDSFSW